MRAIAAAAFCLPLACAAAKAQGIAEFHCSVEISYGYGQGPLKWRRLGDRVYMFVLQGTERCASGGSCCITRVRNREYIVCAGRLVVETRNPDSKVFIDRRSGALKGTLGDDYLRGRCRRARSRALDGPSRNARAWGASPSRPTT